MAGGELSQSQWRHDPAIVNIWLKFEFPHYTNIDEAIYAYRLHLFRILQR
jgi:hypothetical protein